MTKMTTQEPHELTIHRLECIIKFQAREIERLQQCIREIEQEDVERIHQHNTECPRADGRKEG